ncbi:hypothetical protein Halru_0308 [Halovivax ruber XH-70]|uniref:Uncharacterized protein n=1 Tax=Halovivax ruber (strain DSM 18193 / JCM 13892 / XH-70) TaxID=797302 RepID=L0IAH6_HALRX|nr:hypothetical protein [Halovivax ruber]AGB14952.1 hypothetical protein Halru_0308 [Halovivax ruber XH-70]
MAPPAGDGGSPAPIDRPILEFLQTHLQATKQVAEAVVTDSSGHLELHVTLSASFYPESVTEATLSVRWYTNDDFSVHYRESHEDHTWDCRWDRHPNSHNSRDHFHPPPRASTPGDDASWPTDYRDVLRLVLGDIETRLTELWNV